MPVTDRTPNMIKFDMEDDGALVVIAFFALVWCWILLQAATVLL